MKYILKIIIFFICSQAFAVNEYAEKSSQLNKIEKRIQDKDKQLKEILKAKNLSNDEEEQKTLIKQSIKVHAEYIDFVKEYNKLRNEVKYKFPEKGDTTERRYLPINEHSIEEIENETGMDSLLTRVKNKTQKKYKKFTSEDQNQATAKPEPLPGSKPTKKKLRLEK